MLFQKFKVGDTIQNFTEINEFNAEIEYTFKPNTRFTVVKIIKQKTDEDGCQLIRLKKGSKVFTVSGIWFENPTKLERALL